MLKLFFLFLVIASQEVVFASTTINEAELRRFSSTQVNDTFDQISRDVSAYLKITGHTRLPEGESAIFQAPLPGQEGKLDATITLLRFSPMQNQAIAEAQLKLVRNFLAEKIFEEYEGIIVERESERQNLENRITRLVSSLKSARGDNGGLLALIKVLSATLAELSTKTQQQLVDTQKNAVDTINRLTSEANNVAALLKAALDS